jgi:hypothetical protein
LALEAIFELIAPRVNFYDWNLPRANLRAWNKCSRRIQFYLDAKRYVLENFGKKAWDNRTAREIAALVRMDILIKGPN